ncbi:glycosyltransferase WbuB [Bradyrhizobium sp. HKCCYLS3077]|uniref:glycosyltransferase WbuB n=1 Tax=Bradyrhizobium sp. HKCCYLS3077 TaxID=3420761 RepID=UPI003EBD1252
MRLLVIGINYAPDLIGVAKYNSEMCEGLAALGHDVRIVTAPPYYPDWVVPAEYRSLWYARDRARGVDLIRAPIYVPKSPSGLKRLVHHGSFLLSASAPVLSSALRWRPDIVVAVAPSLLSAMLAVTAARIANAPCWLHVQDFEVDAAFELGLLGTNARARALMLGLERRLMDAFDHVSTISPQMLRCLRRKGLSAEKLSEFRNWIDTDAIAPGTSATCFRAQLGLGASDVIALYSGAMSNKQGLDLVIDMASGLRGRSSLHFVLCGNGPVKPELIRMAEGLANVHFLDLQPSERLSELLSTADIHLLPQKAQISDLVLPSKLAGILASGRPVVAMAAPGSGIAEEIDGAGLLVSPGDVGALSAAVVRLAEDEEMRATLGRVARIRARQNWDRSAVIRGIEREFAALAECRPTKQPRTSAESRPLPSAD